MRLGDLGKTAAAALQFATGSLGATGLLLGGGPAVALLLVLAYAAVYLWPTAALFTSSRVTVIHNPFVRQPLKVGWVEGFR